MLDRGKSWLIVWHGLNPDRISVKEHNLILKANFDQTIDLFDPANGPSSLGYMYVFFCVPIVLLQ